MFEKASGDTCLFPIFLFFRNQISYKSSGDLPPDHSCRDAIASKSSQYFNLSCGAHLKSNLSCN